MKIYIIIEGQYERIIRGVTLCKETASKICEMFSYTGCFFEEYETLEDENLKNILGDIKL